MKETWAIINKLVNQRSKTTKINSLSDGNQLIQNPQDIANKMNKFFCTVGEELSKEIPDTKKLLLEGNFIVNPDNLSFSFSPLSPQQLVKAMNKFKTSKSFGLDLISSYFLKLGMPIFASSLSQIFNLSMSRGIFPDSWKIARVAPVHKKAQLMINLITDPSRSYQLLLVYLKN